MGKNSPPKWINRTSKGSIGYRKDTGVYYVRWYDPESKKTVKIYKYRGLHLYSREMAQKLLNVMQGDWEQGTFKLDKYRIDQYTDVVAYLWEWWGTIKGTLAPATAKDYSNSIRNHLAPFFRDHPVQLGEIQYDTLLRLLQSIERGPKGRLNVMYCLRRCLSFAYKSRRISEVPPFPEKGLYGVKQPVIEWLPYDRQMKIIEAIPLEHRPIFLWLKFHLRRPGEGMALHLVDYDSENDTFIIRRGISARRYVDYTKTKAVHEIPCHSDFRPLIPALKRQALELGRSPYLFTCRTSRNRGKRYSSSIMGRLWKRACKATGESISLYAGLKHSSCSQLVNEMGLSLSELQTVTDHARAESVQRYARVEIARKRELLERKVVPLDRRKVSGTNRAR